MRGFNGYFPSPHLGVQTSSIKAPLLGDSRTVDLNRLRRHRPSERPRPTTKEPRGTRPGAPSRPDPPDSSIRVPTSLSKGPASPAWPRGGRRLPQTPFPECEHHFTQLGDPRSRRICLAPDTHHQAGAVFAQRSDPVRGRRPGCERISDCTAVSRYCGHCAAGNDSVPLWVAVSQETSCSGST